MYVVYILKSQKIERYYIGVTQDIEKRLIRHNTSRVKATKPYTPWKLLHTEQYNEKSEAYKREYYLKSPQGYQEKLRLIRLYD